MAVLFLGLRGHSWNDGRKTSPNIPCIHFPERIYAIRQRLDAANTIECSEAARDNVG